MLLDQLNVFYLTEHLYIPFNVMEEQSRLMIIKFTDLQEVIIGSIHLNTCCLKNLFLYVIKVIIQEWLV